MAEIDSALLAGRPRRAVVVPTAASLEGDGRVAYWIDLARQHFEAMDVEPVPLDVRTRQQADDPRIAGQVRGTGLVYLSGGDPHHLAHTLRSSALWGAIVEAWRCGAALAGCSAGAMALTAGAPPELLARVSRASRSGPPAPGANGLGLVPGLAVIPHFDQLERLRPGSLEWFGAWQPAGTVLVGVEENTALVGDTQSWRVSGAGRVWIIDTAGRRPYAGAEPVDLPPLP